MVFLKILDTKLKCVPCHHRLQGSFTTQYYFILDLENDFFNRVFYLIVQPCF